MTDGQIRKLFVAVAAINEELGKIRLELEAVRRESHRAASNSDLVLQGYQEHGTSIEVLERAVAKLRIKCPLIKTDTSELAKVG